MSITIDDLIERLTVAKQVSPLKGDTVVHLCEEDREYIPFNDAKLDVDQNGAVFILSTTEI